MEDDIVALLDNNANWLKYERRNHWLKIQRWTSLTHSKEAIKLVALYQGRWNKWTRWRARAFIVRTSKEMNQLETALNNPSVGHSALDSTDENWCRDTIQSGDDFGLSLEELAGLKMAIDEHKKKRNELHKNSKMVLSARAWWPSIR